MSVFKDLTGQIFGILKVLRISSKRGNDGQIYYWVKCLDCTIEKEVVGASLTSGNTTSCGNPKTCKGAFAIFSNAAMQHGLSKRIEYQSLNGMEQRCYNPDNPAFHRYGGRKDIYGNPDPIIIYGPWRNNIFSFILYTMFCMPKTLAQFKLDNPGKTATIDRIDSKGHYVPRNIQWATYQEQNQNRENYNVINSIFVKIILIEKQISNKTNAEIFRFLQSNHNYQGSKKTVNNIINRKTWANIIVTAHDISEYKQFGTINMV